MGYRRLGRRRREDGQGTVEYEILIACGALLVIAAMLLLARGTDHLLRHAAPAPARTVFQPPVAHCDASYDGVCIPPAPPDLDCGDLAALGVPVPVTVVGADPHALDPDGDGLGC